MNIQCNNNEFPSQMKIVMMLPHVMRCISSENYLNSRQFGYEKMMAKKNYINGLNTLYMI